MDHFTRLKKQVTRFLLVVMVGLGFVLIASGWLLRLVTDSKPLIAGILAVETISLAAAAAMMAATYVLEPLKLLWQAIVHVSPGSVGSVAPNLQAARLGRELITALSLEIYQMASAQPTKNKDSAPDVQANTIIANLPLPLIVMDKTQTIDFANEAAHKYLGVGPGELTGKNFYSKLNLLFPSQDTLDNWLTHVRERTVTASRSWEHVRLQLPEQPKPLQFDLAVHYSKQSSSNVETIVALFDHSATYGQQDNDISYMALTVHELRTPLTLIRGYIELFEQELANKLDPELQGFMHKMKASGQQLDAIVTNILNVSRVESDQLVLQLHEENWNQIVTSAAEDLALRAYVKQKKIELQLAADLPTVAVDKISIYEVLVNLIDNAIKYSGDSKTIVVKTAMADGNFIQTTVEDYGVGIPTSIVPHLFEKFYRSHHTEQHVSGTGLGLYLSKAIVTAHGGNIWLRSKEGEGTTIGFTVKPYAELAAELEASDNKAITRQANGWIKNHSLFRK